VKPYLKSLASLKLTVALLAVSMLLVLAGTLAQIDMGIWQVQKKYFHSLLVWVEFQVFLPRPAAGGQTVPGGFPLPGGYTIGALMLVNLLAAHSIRFKLTWRRSGIIMIHLGLILLLLGELATSLFAVESQMTIDEGQTVAYSQDIRTAELAVIDPSAPDSDAVIAFPESSLVPGAKLRHSMVPFEMTVHEYEPNSELLGPRQAPPDALSKATAGFGKGVVLKPQPRTAGTDGGTDMASAHVTLMSDGRLIGIYLLSFYFEEPQPVVAGGKTWLIALRFQRYYKPYTMKLLKFSHDRYLGTDTPKNFSSRLRLADPAENVDREVLIRMNEPLRYGGETYYQASFKPGDKTTILQVVSNPAWTMPYIACTVGGAGMAVHFIILLVGFLRKRKARAAGVPRERLSGEFSIRTLAFPFGVLALSLASVLWALKPASRPGPEEFDYAAFGNFPVTYDGRVMPIDTLARSTLQAISGRQTTRMPATDAAPSEWSKVPSGQWKSITATQWLADVFSGTERAAEYRVFRIDHPGVLGMLGLDQDRSPRLYSFHEILDQKEKLQEQVELISDVDDKKRDPFQRKVADLHQRLQIFLRLADLSSLYLVPPVAANEEWQPIGNFAAARGGHHPAAQAMLGMLAARHENKPADFNKEVAAYDALIAGSIPSETGMARYEAFFNRFDPFYRAQILYVVVSILGCASWLVWSKPLGRAAYLVLFLCLLVHTFGMISRIVISGRPPVTNLYSSAVFIAWGGVLLAAILEFFSRNMIATVTSAAMGFTSLLIAHRLAGDGDTMRMMQAVLDTNFWLATHVVVITLGYASTFLAGILAISYIVLGVFTRHLTAPAAGRAEEDAPAAVLPRMVYAILCFAMLFSFVGTVLGGIWADQSWGRFWGWDPKENGAVLIVIWNALILHARMAGFAKDRGLMLLAIFGNVVTSWSWFGTNMLGVGLHSYGFMESAAFWLLMFVGSQLGLIALGNLPLRKWRSFCKTTPPHLD